MRISRWKAAGIHLAISLLLACAVGSLIYFVWYPQPYFFAAGASTLMMLIMGVDVAIGPLLTLVACNPKKTRRHLAIDLSVIGTLQAIAFLYGLSIIVAARPAFIVAEVDRFVLVSANELEASDLAEGSRPEYRHAPWWGPLLVGATAPRDGKTMDRVLSTIETGKDINLMPKYYVPYDEVAKDMLKRAKSLDKLRGGDARIKAQLEDRMHASVVPLFLPLRARTMFHTALVSPVDARPLNVLPIDPWQ